MALSPMMQQYMQIHEKYVDCLLLFRLGDFYELFFEDAKTASRELELTLTGRDCGLEERAPMCGVPYHAVNTYVERLIEKGYKVAICEQLEDPALAKGLVERDVVRVITAGTVTDSSMLEEKSNNYLLCVYVKGKEIGLAFADVSTGEFFVSEPLEAELRAEISRIGAHEILCNDALRLREATGLEIPLSSQISESWFQPKNAGATLMEQFHLSSLTPLGLEEHRSAVSAAGALMKYLRETQKNSLEHMRTLRFAESGRTMMLDPNTRRNLELTESLRGKGKKGTLLGLLDQTATAMGGRMLKSWLEQPLLQRGDILARHDAVGELADNPVLTASIPEELTGVYDMERLLSKVAYRSLNARDCLALCASL